MSHIPVLLQEVERGLAPRRGDVILDATVGGGGHSEALCEAVSGDATFICLDADEGALDRSRKRLSKSSCKFLFLKTNFRDLDVALDSLRVSKINCAIFDLGMSSDQVDAHDEGRDKGRGFSFQNDEPLIMTFDDSPSKTVLTAKSLVNSWDEENIATILRIYGEEPKANRIAGAIISARKKKPIETSRELADLISAIIPRRGKIHPATKTFQAIRIAVNDEIRALSDALAKSFERLAAGGRIAVISFHSLEDRVVKRFFKEKAILGKGILITKKPLIASEDEINMNPRARSAKLRIIEKK